MGTEINEGGGGRNPVTCAIGCPQCPQNVIVAGTVDDAMHLREQVGKVVKCSNCGVEWTLVGASVRMFFTSDPMIANREQAFINPYYTPNPATIKRVTDVSAIPASWEDLEDDSNASEGDV